jgi:hypothetical protein
VAKSKLRTALWVLIVFLVIAAVGVIALYLASRHVPEFYARALEADPVAQREASDVMLQQTAALASDVKKPGRWQALFTAEQINGWLAVDLPENHPDALPRGIEDPRVAITPEGITIGCRFRRSGIDSVVSLAVDPNLPEPNVLAVRIGGARAGMVPIPLKDLLDAMSQAAARLDFPLQWKQTEGDPVAVISIPSSTKEHGTLVRVDTLRLGDGEIYMAGTTERREPEDGSDGPP